MHLVSLECLGFRNLDVNRYTTDYCYMPYIYIPLNLSGPAQLECNIVQGARTRIENKHLSERQRKDIVEQVRRRKWTWAVRI